MNRNLGVSIHSSNRITDELDFKHAETLFEKRASGYMRYAPTIKEINDWKCSNAISSVNTNIDKGKSGYCPFYKIKNIEEVKKGKPIIMEDVDNPCYQIEIKPSCIANTIKDNDKEFVKLFPKFLNEKNYLSSARSCKEALLSISNIFCGTNENNNKDEKLDEKKCKVIDTCKNNNIN